MVYVLNHILLRFNGHFGTASGIVDKWSVGMRFGLTASEPIYDVAKLQTFVNAANTLAQTFHAGGSSGTGTSTYYDYCSGAQIGVLGKYSPVGQLTVLSPSSATAGTGTPIHSWDTASVFSLRTATPRGRGSNGRVYWPCQALAINPTTGRVTSGLMPARVGLFKTFADGLNAAANAYSPGTRLLVASAVGGGFNAVVTAVRADDRLDSIERRENAQPSVWSSAALA
jgi:hypothetical protein